MSDTILVEELTLKPIGNSEELGFRPLRVIINGTAQPPIFDAREIAALKDAIKEHLSN
jgi:hypothetical protein